MTPAIPIVYPSNMPPGIQDAFKKHNNKPIKKREKPLFVIDVDIVKVAVKEFKTSMPPTDQIDVVHFCAVKACAARPVTDVYDELGCGFDCASKGEAKQLVNSRIDPTRLSLGNCNIPTNELEWGIKTGIQYYAVDSMTQIDRMIEAAGAVAKDTNGDLATILANLKLFCRLVCSGKGSDKPFSDKFGVDSKMAFTLIEAAQAKGLTFVGLSGHPGTQNFAEDAFVQFAQLFRKVFDHVRDKLDITMSLANIGGGWAGISTKTAPSFTDYNKPTMEAFSSTFANWPVKLTIMTEPGRAFISKAGWLQTHVINISAPTLGAEIQRVSLSAGTLHGLNEANKVSFEWHTSYPSKMTKPWVLYGASCDSSDIILGKNADGTEKTIHLPSTLHVDQLVWVYGPAAYGPAYSTSFNGVPPPKVVYINYKRGITSYFKLHLRKHKLPFSFRPAGLRLKTLKDILYCF